MELLLGHPRRAQNRTSFIIAALQRRRVERLHRLLLPARLAAFLRHNLDPPNLKRVIQSRAVKKEPHHHHLLHLQRRREALHRAAVRIQHRQAFMEAAPFLPPPNSNRRIFRSTENQLLDRHQA